MQSRRSHLQVLLGGLAGLASCKSFDPAGTSSPTAGQRRPPVVPEASFENVVDIVDDFGGDGTGERPVDDALESALADDTLVTFPEGEYRFERGHTFEGFERVGVAGRGSVTFVPPSPWNGKLFETSDVGAFLATGFDIDITASNTTVGLKLRCHDGVQIEDIRFLGRGTHTDADVLHALNIALREDDGTGLVRNLVARHGSAVDRYKDGDGRGGVYIGPANRGTVSIEACHFAEFGNNGIYASRTPGDVRVVGGTFLNNNPTAVRLSGRGSYVANARIEVDPSRYTGPRFDGSNSKLRGVVVEQKTEDRSLLKPAGMAIRDCRIEFKQNPTSGPPVVVWSNGKTLTIDSCRIHVENDTPAVLREGLDDQGTNPPWRGDRWVEIVDSHITGAGAHDDPGVRLVDAPESRVRNSRIRRRGAGTTGVELVRSGRSTVTGGSIRANSYPLVLRPGSDAEDCLLWLVDEPGLEMAGPARTGDRRLVACSTGRDVTASDADSTANCCITPRALSDTAPSPHSDIGILGRDGAALVVHRL